MFLKVVISPAYCFEYAALEIIFTASLPSFPFILFILIRFPLISFHLSSSSFLVVLLTITDNVEMEIVLPGDMTVRESHDIALALQHKIEALEDVERAFVHVRPSLCGWSWCCPTMAILSCITYCITLLPPVYPLCSTCSTCQCKWCTTMKSTDCIDCIYRYPYSV